jgi:zinc protease
MHQPLSGPRRWRKQVLAAVLAAGLGAHGAWAAPTTTATPAGGASSPAAPSEPSSRSGPSKAPAKAKPTTSPAAAKAHPAPAKRQAPLFSERLPNGVLAVVYEDHHTPLVSLNVFVKVGSMYEDERTNGLSHFFEHLFFRGTARRTGEEFKREIESLGGHTNAKTTKDLTQFYINLPSVYAREGLDILADAWQNTRLQPSEVEQERKVVMDEYRMSLENPGAIAQSLIAEMMYERHPYRLPIIGTEKSLTALRIGDFIDFKKKYYTPLRTVVVLVGDVTPKQIMPTVRDLFGSYQAPETPVETYTDGGDPPPTHDKVVRRDQQSAFVLLSFKAPSVRDRPDIYRVDLMTFLLGQGDGSLLHDRLVEKQKIAQSASCDFLTQRDEGLITMMTVSQPGKVEKNRSALLQAVDDVRAGQFSDGDFERARNLLMNTYRFGNETYAGMAEGLGFYASIDKVEFALGYLDEVAKVTRQDVVEAARKYLDIKKSSLLVVRPPDRRAYVEP